MKQWFLYKASFWHDYLGGYRLSDNAGTLLYIAEDEFGYMPADATRSNSVAMRNTSIPAMVECNAETFHLDLYEIKEDDMDMAINEFVKWQESMFRLIAPASLEKTGFQLDLLLPRPSEKEVFETLRKIDTPLFDKLSHTIHSPKLSQNFNFRFKEGSFTTVISIEGYSMAPRSPHRSVVNFFQTSRQAERTKRINSEKPLLGGNSFQWAVHLIISILEDSPISPAKENGWNHDGFSSLQQKAWQAAKAMFMELT